MVHRLAACLWNDVRLSGEFFRMGERLVVDSALAETKPVGKELIHALKKAKEF